MFDFKFSNKKHGKQKAKKVLSNVQAEIGVVIVDVAYMFGIMIKKEYLNEGYFTTTKPYSDVIENQEITFAKLQVDDEFWAYICNRNRKIILPIHQKIEEFIKTGIPPRYRGRIWRNMIGIQSKTSQFLSYSDLFELPRQEETVYQIKLDVPRTFPNIEDPSFNEKLGQVLIAYSLRNPKLGYCQSMNFIAGTLLLFMEEEAAFWMLVHIVEELLVNYFVPTMSGYHVDADVFDKIVAENLPELYEHFRKINLSCKVLTSTWFLSLFINDFPVVTAYLMWDSIMWNGITAMFEFGVTVLSILQSELLQKTDQVTLMQYLRYKTLQMHDPKPLINGRIRLDKAHVLSIRRKIGQKVEEEALYNVLSKQFADLESATHYDSHELVHLWRQYTQLDPFLAQSTTSGLDQEQFAQLMGGTLSEWYADSDLVARLFLLADTNRDGIVGFAELISLFSVMCRGTFNEIVKFNFELFDIKSKGWIDSFDLLRMLQSIYGMYKEDKSFYKRLHLITNEIFSRFAGAIKLENFKHVVHVQAQIMDKMKARNPTTLYNYQKSYYYWMFDADKSQRKTEMIRLSIDKQAIRKQSTVPSPTLYL